MDEETKTYLLNEVRSAIHYTLEHWNEVRQEDYAKMMLELQAQKEE